MTCRIVKSPAERMREYRMRHGEEINTRNRERYAKRSEVEKEKEKGKKKLYSRLMREYLGLEYNEIEKERKRMKREAIKGSREDEERKRRAAENEMQRRIRGGENLRYWETRRKQIKRFWAVKDDE